VPLLSMKRRISPACSRFRLRWSQRTAAAEKRERQTKKGDGQDAPDFSDEVLT